MKKFKGKLVGRVGMVIGLLIFLFFVVISVLWTIFGNEPMELLTARYENQQVEVKAKVSDKVFYKIYAGVGGNE